MLCVLPHAQMVPAMVPFDERVRELLGAEIRSGDAIDQVSACLVLLTRSQVGSDPLVTESLDSGAPALRDIAELVRRRMGTSGTGYAQAGNLPSAMVGPTLSLLREQAAAAAAAAAAQPETPPVPIDEPDGGG